jgi:hypothetical protein
MPPYGEWDWKEQGTSLVWVSSSGFSLGETGRHLLVPDLAITFSNVNNQWRTEMSVKLKVLNREVSKRLTVLKVVTTLHLHAIRNLRVHMQPETSTKNKVGDKITAILSQLVPPPFFSQVA